MRDYGIVTPQFWIGSTGKALRGKPDLQVLALYLMTSPHATMIGIYHLPMAYIVNDTGLSAEGASKGLRCLSGGAFCTYDEPSEMIFVHKMAFHQIGMALRPGDKRIRGVEKEIEKVSIPAFRNKFIELYGKPFNLSTKPLASPSEAPCKPLASQDQDQDQDQEQDQERRSPREAPSPTPSAPAVLGGKSVDEKLKPYQQWIEKAIEHVAKGTTRDHARAMVNYFNMELQRSLADFYESRGGKLTPTRLGYIGSQLLQRNMEAALIAVELFVDRHAGSKDERYLAGIARRLDKGTEQEMEAEHVRHRKTQAGRGLWAGVPKS